MSQPLKFWLATSLVAVVFFVSPLTADPTTTSDTGERQPLEAFLLPTAEEIALARSAAPDTVADAATVLTLTEEGYHTAVEGSNGFTCVVLRSFTRNVTERPDPLFWSPRLRIPICYNAEATDTELAKQLLKSDLALGGTPREEIPAAVSRALSNGTLRLPTGSAMAYMMSEEQYLGDRVKNWKPHLMLYLPYAENTEWGDHPRGGDLPFVFLGEGSPQAVVIVPVAEFVPVRRAAAG